MSMPGTAATAFARRGGLSVLTWPMLDRFDVDVMVTTRWGGVSSGPYATLNVSLSVGDEPARVLENRRRVAAALGADLGDFVFARQVHGARAQVVSAADRGRGAFTAGDAIPEVDALVTGDPGVVLAVLAADCAVIVLYDPVHHVVGCVHAGWRGTMARAAESAVVAMRSLGTRPEDVVAGIGPVVAPDRYQVGVDVYRATERCLGDRAGQVIRPDRSVRPGATPDGSVRWLLDTAAANRLVLRDAGVPDEHIHITDTPTGPLPSPTHGRARPTGPADRDAWPTDPTSNRDGSQPGDTADTGLFFSDRAQRPCGRHALVARLRTSVRRGDLSAEKG